VRTEVTKTQQPYGLIHRDRRHKDYRPQEEEQETTGWTTTKQDELNGIKNAGGVIPARNGTETTEPKQERNDEPKGRETERTKTQQPYGLIHRDRMRIETHTESETTEPKGRIKTRRNRNQDDVRSTRVGSRRITGHNKRRYKTRERRIENHTQLERNGTKEPKRRNWNRNDERTRMKTTAYDLQGWHKARTSYNTIRTHQEGTTTKRRTRELTR